MNDYKFDFYLDKDCKKFFYSIVANDGLDALDKLKEKLKLKTHTTIYCKRRDSDNIIYKF